MKIALSWRIVPFEIYEWEATDKSPTHNFQTVNSSFLIKLEIEFSKVEKFLDNITFLTLTLYHYFLTSIIIPSVSAWLFTGFLRLHILKTEFSKCVNLFTSYFKIKDFSHLLLTLYCKKARSILEKILRSKSKIRARWQFWMSLLIFMALKRNSPNR